MLDPSAIHYGHIKVLQLRTDLGKSKQPFGFRWHSEESPNSSMRVHTCARQGNLSLMLIHVSETLRTVSPSTNHAASVQAPMIVDFGEGGGWTQADSDEGSEPQSVSS